MKKRTLRGTKITGNWADKQPDGRKGKRCEVTSENELNTPGSAVLIHSVKECAEQVCRSHFFEPATMRFFKSRISDVAYVDGRGGAYFTSSEKGPNDIRAYSVRHYDPTRCSVGTVGKFQGYRTKPQADRAAKQAAMQAGLGRRTRR